MKTKEIKAQKRRLHKLGVKWLEPLGLLWWTVEHQFYGKRKQFRRGDGAEALMVTYADWRYRRATIEVNAPLMAEIGDQELEEDYVHELAHILVNEMRGARDDARDHEERVATTLAAAFLWVRGAR